MLVTFETKAYPPITMLGDVAATMLGLMGMSGQVPGAIRAADVGDALQRLRNGVGSAEPADTDNDCEEDSGVELAVRAYPLIKLLSIAADEGYDVTWKHKRTYIWPISSAG